jgi:hypothetical protein
MYNKIITPGEKMNLANFINLYKLRIQKEIKDKAKYFEDLYICTDIVYTNKSDPLKDPITEESIYPFDVDSENWDIILKKDTSLKGVSLENLIKDYGNKMVEQVVSTEDETGIHIFKLTIK